MAAAPVSKRCMKSPSQDLVRQMRTEGLADDRVRARLQAKGFTKSRISQLLRAVPRHRKLKSPRRAIPAPAKKRGPAISLDALRQLGEASALEAARDLTRSGSPISARLSCQYIGVSTGANTFSSTAQALRNSTLVYIWRLVSNGQERTAVATTSARCDSITKYVTLPDQLKKVLKMEAHYMKVLAEARQAFPGTTFSIRLGVPRKLEPPPHPYAPGAAVMIRLPSGHRVEHVLCAHVSGDLWYCHAGSPKEGSLNTVKPFCSRDLVIHTLARCWCPWQLQRKRLRGRCTKRNLTATAVDKRACFERVVAIAKWKAEAYRAQERKVPMHVAAASAGVDFTEEAFQEAATRPWTSTVFAVWQWDEKAFETDLHTCFGADIQMRYALRSASYRLFHSTPQAVLPDRQSV